MPRSVQRDQRDQCVKPSTRLVDAGSGNPAHDHQFARAVVVWQKNCGRHGLPWQQQRDAYSVWLSEVMLQQTQVATVIPYFGRFLGAFPSVVALADADQARVMELWSGLGYYSRARNLHRCAQIVRDQHRGNFPQTLSALCDLPGIGRSTAAAIAVFAFGQRQAILDGNVKRVFCRHFGIGGEINRAATISELWDRAEFELPPDNLVAYTQGLMDLGATCCTRTKPQCTRCPIAASCVALDTDSVQALPARSRRKQVPQRRVTMLVLTRQYRARTQVWLTRRPDSGIWGGLLSLPESALHVDETVSAHLRDAGLTAAHCVRDIADNSHALRQLPAVDHVFTHFRLRIEPLLFSVGQHFDASDPQPAGDWLDLAKVRDAGLPAPVKKLLAALQPDARPDS